MAFVELKSQVDTGPVMLRCAAFALTKNAAEHILPTKHFVAIGRGTACTVRASLSSPQRVGRYNLGYCFFCQIGCKKLHRQANAPEGSLVADQFERV